MVPLVQANRNIFMPGAHGDDSASKRTCDGEVFLRRRLRRLPCRGQLSTTRIWADKVNEAFAIHIYQIPFRDLETTVALVEGIAAPTALGHAADKGAIAKAREHDIARLRAHVPLAAHGTPDLAVGCGQAHPQPQPLLSVLIQPGTFYLSV